MATLKLRVSGMSCGHCQAKVAAALQTTAGVYTAIVDLRAGEAEIDFNDDTVRPQQLAAAAERAGEGGNSSREYWPRSSSRGATWRRSSARQHQRKRVISRSTTLS